MNDKSANDWGNYWQGRAASEHGAALIGVGVGLSAIDVLGQKYSSPSVNFGKFRYS